MKTTTALELSSLSELVYAKNYTFSVGEYIKDTGRILWRISNRDFTNELSLVQDYTTKETSKLGEKRNLTKENRNISLEKGLNISGFGQSKKSEHVDVKMCFVSWNQLLHVSNKTDIIPRERRLYYNVYKPYCESCFEHDTPLFVVLNGPPFSMIYTSNLCKEIGKYYECVSIDLMSIGNAKIFGDSEFSYRETDYLNEIKGEYNFGSFIEEIKACCAIITNNLEKTMDASSIAHKRPIVILSTLFTTYHASVLAGSNLINDKFDSNVVCFYLSSSVFPNVTHSYEQTNLFCKSTGYTKDVDYEILKDGMTQFLEELITRDEKDFQLMQTPAELVQKQIRNIDIDLKALTQQSLDTILRYGVPEKACTFISNSSSLAHLQAVFIDLERSIKTTLFSNRGLRKFFYFTPDKSKQEFINKNFPHITVCYESVGLKETIASPENTLNLFLKYLDDSLKTTYFEKKNAQIKSANKHKSSKHKHHLFLTSNLPMYESLTFWKEDN